MVMYVKEIRNPAQPWRIDMVIYWPSRPDTREKRGNLA